MYVVLLSPHSLPFSSDKRLFGRVCGPGMYLGKSARIYSGRVLNIGCAVRQAAQDQRGSVYKGDAGCVKDEDAVGRLLSTCSTKIHSMGGRQCREVYSGAACLLDTQCTSQQQTAGPRNERCGGFAKSSCQQASCTL